MSDLSRSIASWLSRALTLPGYPAVPARLREDVGLPSIPSIEGRAWTDADRRRRLPL